MGRRVGANYSLFYLCVVCMFPHSHLYFGSFSKWVIAFLADLMILFLCSAKLVSCALKPKRAGADIDKSTLPPSIILSIKLSVKLYQH